MTKKTFFILFFSLIAITFAAHADPELVIEGQHKKWIFEEIENDENTKQKIVDALLAHAPKLSAEGNFPGDVSLIFPIAYGEDGALSVGAIEICALVNADRPKEKPFVRAYFDLAHGDFMLAIQRDGLVPAAEKAFGEGGFDTAEPVCPGELYEALGIQPAKITVGHMMLMHVPFFCGLMKRLYAKE